MLKLELRCAKRITVRDIYSNTFVEGSITGERIPFELDPALGLESNVRSARKALETLGLNVDDSI